MAACTACLDKLLVGLDVPEEMAGETDIFVDAEMFITLKVAVTSTARDIYSIDLFFNMIPVGEFDTVEVDILCQQFFCAVAFRPQTGFF
jgi:hypothetical protein